MAARSVPCFRNARVCMRPAKMSYMRSARTDMRPARGSRSGLKPGGSRPLSPPSFFTKLFSNPSYSSCESFLQHPCAPFFCLPCAPLSSPHLLDLELLSSPLLSLCFSSTSWSRCHISQRRLETTQQETLTTLRQLDGRIADLEVEFAAFGTNGSRSRLRSRGDAPDASTSD